MWGKETMKVFGLTETECSMMHVLTKRLGSISSPYPIGIRPASWRRG